MTSYKGITRRDFIKHGGVALAGLASAGAMVGCAGPAPLAARPTTPEPKGLPMPKERTTLPPVRIGMAQMLVEGGKADANLARARDMIARAAAEGCKFVVLPECLDLGWVDESISKLAQPIPGPHVEKLARAAKESRIYVVAGLNERAGDRLYNAAVVISPAGELLHHHRKINLLVSVEGVYAIGDRLGVVHTPYGTVGVNICADNSFYSLAQGHMLARMGASLILSPCAWAVEPDHDNQKSPYGDFWIRSYAAVTKLYELTTVGVSNVGWVSGGPWKGWKAIGCSLAVGPAGTLLKQAPYGTDAQTLMTLDVEPVALPAMGANWPGHLKPRGYDGVL